MRPPAGECMEVTAAARPHKRKRCEAAAVEASTSCRFLASRKVQAFRGYPDILSTEDDELKQVLRECGLEQLYSSLEWNWIPFDFIVDFVGHVQITESASMEEQTMLYFPYGSETPIAFTMERVAGTFNLGTEGFCVDKATVKDVDVGGRYQLQKTVDGESYYSVTSAATNALHILARFVIQVIFLSHTTKGTVVSMRHLQAGLSGEGVAWGKLLWKYLLKRVLSYQQHGQAGDFYEKLRTTHSAFAATLGALLLRVEIEDIPEHEAWYMALLETLPVVSDSETDRDETKEMVVEEAPVQPAVPLKSSLDDSQSSPTLSQTLDSREEGPNHEKTVGVDMRSRPSNPIPAAGSCVDEQKATTTPGANDHAGFGSTSNSREQNNKPIYAAGDDCNQMINSHARGHSAVFDSEAKCATASEVTPSKVAANCKQARVRLFPGGCKLSSMKAVSDRDGRPPEELSGFQLLDNITNAVKEWTERVSVNEPQGGRNLDTSNIDRRKQDLCECVNRANKDLEGAVNAMKRQVQELRKQMEEKYDVWKKLIGHKDQLVKSEDMQQTDSCKETRDAAGKAAAEWYPGTEKVPNLKVDIMTFQNEIKLMNLFIHANFIKLEQREVQVQMMKDAIQAMCSTLNSLDNEICKDCLWEDIRKLLDLKGAKMDTLLKEVRGLNSSLKQLQEKLENEAELLELLEEEIELS